MNPVPKEFADLFDTQGAEVSDAPDFLKTIVDEAALGAGLGRGERGYQHAHNLVVEAQEFDKPLAAHYAKLPKIASDAQAKINQPAAPAPAGSPYLFAAPLAKGAIASRLYKLLGELRPYCIDNEATLLEKAIKAADVSCFAEIAEGVVRRAHE